MATNLRAETEGEAPLRELLNGPGAHRHYGRAARKRDADGRAEFQCRCGLSCECHDGEGIILRFRDDERIVAELFQQFRIIVD